MITNDVLITRLRDKMSLNPANITAAKSVAPSIRKDTLGGKSFVGSCYVEAGLIVAETDDSLETRAGLPCGYDPTTHFGITVWLICPTEYLPALWLETQAALTDWQISDDVLDLLPMRYIQGKLMDLSNTGRLWNDEFKLTLTDIRMENYVQPD